MHVVDEPGLQAFATRGRTTADADVLAVRGCAGCLEALRGRGVDEVERRAARHLERRADVVRQDEDRGVERRLVAPPALPVGVLVPAGIAVLAGAHDLR